MSSNPEIADLQKRITALEKKFSAIKIAIDDVIKLYQDIINLVVVLE